MTELLSFDLGGFGELTVLERVDTDCGAVRLHLTGRRAAGVVVVTPDLADDEPIPRWIRLQYGDGDRWLPARHTNKPEFNGVAIEGGTVVDPDAAFDNLQYRLNLHRPGGGWRQHEQYPPRAAAYATAAIGALISRWRTHPLREELVLAAARHSARRRIANLLEYEIRPRWAQVATLTAPIDRAYALVEQLRQLT